MGGGSGGSMGGVMVVYIEKIKHRADHPSFHTILITYILFSVYKHKKGIYYHSHDWSKIKI